jgi:hypothetical protein
MRIKVFLGVLLLTFLCSTASASLWQIDATVIPGAANEGWEDFTVIFNDANDDNIINIGTAVFDPGPDSIYSFSGMSYTGSNTAWQGDYSELDQNPQLDIGPITLQTQIPGFTNNDWRFREGTEILQTGYTRWTYTATQVPVPAALWLLGSGLLGLAISRKRMKS